MSSSSVCQGLQSCLEPGVMEPRVLRLKLATSSGNTSLSFPQEQENHECGDKKGWSFLQSLTKTSHCNKTEDPQVVYVHPTVKRSYSMLNEKSLEMCTESLGSETGSNAGESGDDISLLSLESSTCFTRHHTTNTNCVSKRKNRACNFPPPLTSITDFGVKPHREHGRLILEAVPSPSPRPYFHADRSDGRLTLRLLETFSSSECDDDDDDDVADGEEWSYDEEEDEAQTDQEDSGIEEECVEVENVEDDEMGVTKLGRPIRCKESGNHMFVDGYFELPSLSLCL